MMQAFTAPLAELAEYQEILQKRRQKKGILQIAGCVNSQKTHLMYALGEGFFYRVLVFSSEEKAQKAYEEYRFLDSEVCYYPARDLLFYHADLKGNYLMKQRMEVIRRLAEREKDQEITVITTMDALLDGLSPMEEVLSGRVSVRLGDTVDFTELQNQLSNLGYVREVQIEGPGQFAVRGGILDVFPLTEEVPVRVELWGDEVDSIRTFDVESQRSIENLQEIEIYPAGELESSKKQSFLQYFPKEESLLLLDEPIRLAEQAKETEEEFQESIQKREEAGMEEEKELTVYAVSEILEFMNQFYGIAFTALEIKCKGLQIRETYYIQTKGVNPYNNSFEMLTRHLKRLKRNQYRVILLSGSRTRAKRLAEDLRDYDLSSFYSDDLKREVQPGEIMVVYGHVTQGYEYPMLKFMVISETDIFGRQKKKKRRKTYEGQKIHSFSELKVGDYVVHENHGLGIYQGIEKIEVDKITKDYMKISYAGGSSLYILATQLDLIQKYAGADANKPKLNKLGSNQWTKTKNQVRGAVRKIAEDLVALYAARQEENGYQYEPDTVWQQEFEEMFPFEETEDQLQAISDTKRDMESKKIMDRLICGDVGYGKTEIAIRAAFKAVQERKTGRVSGSHDHSGTTALQYFCPANERIPGAGRSALPVSDTCSAEKNNRRSEKGDGGYPDRNPSGFI